MPLLERPAYRKHHASGKWEVRFYLIDGAHKKRKFKGGLQTRKQAELWFADYQKQIAAGHVSVDPNTGNPVKQSKTLQDLVDQYDAITKSTRRPRSHETEMLGIRNFLKWSSPQKLISSHSKRDCELYLAHISSKAIKSRKRE